MNVAQLQLISLGSRANMPSRENETTVAFISHASADAGIAGAFVSALEENGLACWIAPRDVTPGNEYAVEILEAIDKADIVILLLSEASNLSTHVRREMERAASKDKRIFPVRIEDVQPSTKLEYYVSIHHWLDAWTGSIESHSARLLSAVQSKEEWTKNALLRRRWINRGIVTTALLSAILMALVLLPGYFRSHEEERSGSKFQNLAKLECQRLQHELTKTRIDGLCVINIPDYA